MVSLHVTGSNLARAFTSPGMHLPAYSRAPARLATVERLVQRERKEEGAEPCPLGQT